MFERDELVLERYPELERRTLGGVMREILRELGYEPDRRNDAMIVHRDRGSQISIASVRRMFLFGIWDKGVSYGHGESDSPRAVADAIAAFVFDRRSVAEMESRFPFLTLTSAARAHERGELVEHRWAEYLAWTTEGDNPSQRALLPLVRAASRRTKLRRLFPFVDLLSLRFSRTTGHPYRAVGASAAPVEGELGRYEVFVGPSGTHSLGRGEADWAAATLEDAVADDVGPAVDGTGDD